jgi:glycosyltransferase involved in cell wall biosynthesis
MRVALLTTDSRQHYGTFHEARPSFGTAPEALLQGFAELPGLEVDVLSCLQEPVAPSCRLAENIRFHALHVPKWGWMRSGYAGCIRAVRRKLRELRPDLVHGQGTERDCAVSAIFSGFPNVVTIHGNMAALARMFGARVGSFGWLAARLEDFTLRRTTGVFCNSAYTEHLVRPRARRTWRVPNAIRDPFFASAKTSPNPQRCIVLNVGVISARKRQLELLDLAMRLRRQGVEFELHFIGHADPAEPTAREFLGKVQEAEALGCARYLGPKSTEELIALFDSAHGLIHFPTEEAFGLVVPEAMARNLKVFGARVGGIVDIVAGVPGAELVDPEDWAGLTDTLTCWVRSGFPRPAGADTIVRERYHPRVVARQHLEIYEEVLGRARRPV